MVGVCRQAEGIFVLERDIGSPLVALFFTYSIDFLSY